MKKKSCGVIITDGKIVLGCRPYSLFDKRYYYDIPKGIKEENETYIDTVIRETKEETRIILNPNKLFFAGKFKYLKNKDLFVYIHKLPTKQLPNLNLLKCDSYFQYKNASFPEIISYNYINLNQIQYNFIEPMAIIISNLINTIETL